MARINHRQLGMLSSIAVVVWLAFAPAAGAMTDRRTFDIAAQPMSSALKVFAAQAHVSLQFDYEVLKGLKTAPVKGHMVPRDALSLLLKGSGFTFKQIDGRTIAVRPSFRRSSEQSLLARSGSKKNDGRNSSSAPFRVATAANSGPPATANKSEVGLSSAAPRLQEVVVTAQRRSQLAINVPMTITALSGGDLLRAGVTDTTELGQVTPGLWFTENAGYTTITIRGIGSVQNTNATSNDVAVYLDGSYMSSKTGGIFDLPDISSIQVLKGPQGTLWGRNATAGAVLINTLNPSFTASGNATISYGTLDDQVAKVFLTGPLVDGLLAGSIAGYYEDRKGYVTNIVTDQSDAGGLKSTLMRAKLLLTPAPGVSFLLSSFYSDRTDKDTPLEGFPPGLTFGPSELLTDPNAITASAPLTVATRFSNLYWENRTVNESLKATFDTSLGTLTSIAAYTNIRAPSFVDLSYTSSPLGVYGTLQQPDRSYQEELSFASTSFGPVEFLAGTDYYHDSAGINPLLVYFGAYPSTTPILTSNNVLVDEALDGYLEANIKIGDRLTIIGGVRYTHEKAEEFGSDVAGDFPRVHANSWNPVTPRASVTYEVARKTNIYFTYSKGFKSGTYDSNNYTAPPVNPETVDGFEVGIKSNVSPSISVDASAFYSTYRNIQVSAITKVAIAGGVNLNELLNAATARIYGLDLDLAYRPITDLSLELRLEPLHAAYTSFPNAVVNLPTPLAECPPAAAPVGCGTYSATENASGNWLENAPRTSGSLSADYVTHQRFGDVELNANLFATSKFYWDVANLETQPAYYVLNARISWIPHDSQTTLTIWGKNLTDEYYALGSNVTVGGIVWAPGRTVGIEASRSF